MKRLRHIILMSALLTGAPSVHAQTCNVVLAWDANVEADLAGYQLVWGRAAGTYTNSLVYPKDPVVTTTTPPSRTATLTLTGADCANVKWYIAVKAFNSAGMYSGPSNEVVVPYKAKKPVVRAKPTS